MSEQLELITDEGRVVNFKQEKGYKMNVVCSVFKITKKNLDYWEKTNLVIPSISNKQGSGFERIYSYNDLVKVRIIKSLLDIGVGLQTIRKTLEGLKKYTKEDWTKVTLLSDGKRMYYCKSQDEIIDIMSNGQGVFAIDLKNIFTSLEKSEEILPNNSNKFQLFKYSV